MPEYALAPLQGGRDVRLLDVYAAYQRRLGLPLGSLPTYSYSLKAPQHRHEPLAKLGGPWRSASAPAALTATGSVVSFPSGTGDCAGPKLLQAAALQGLQPLAMAEFWYGSPPLTKADKAHLRTQGGPAPLRPRAGRGSDSEARTHSTHEGRQHGVIYASCARCQPIMGTMLCPRPPPSCLCP